MSVRESTAANGQIRDRDRCIMSSTDIAAQIPEVIEADGDKFVVQSVLGRGGMGTIYKAHQQNLDRIVALKMLIASHYAQRYVRYRQARSSRRMAAGC
jgi:serine/threonine protein kinase